MVGFSHVHSRYRSSETRLSRALTRSHGHYQRTQPGLQSCINSSRIVSDFGLASNATATDEEFVKLLVRSAFRNEFVNTVAKQRLLAQPNVSGFELPRHEPRAKALLYHLRALPLDTVDVQFDRVHEVLFAQAASVRLFTCLVDVAIDIHDWPYYGSKHTDQVLICNKTRGTNRA